MTVIIVFETIGELSFTALNASFFCRVFLNNGEVHGKRYLIASAVNELSKRLTLSVMKESNDLVFSLCPDSYGHGKICCQYVNALRNHARVCMFSSAWWVSRQLD